MKNLKLLKARLVLITAFLAVAVSTMFLAAFPAAEKTVSASTDELTLKINYKNLSYSDQTYILYAVEYAGLYADSAEVELLFWRSTDGGLNKGSEDYSESERYTQKIGGKTHHVFYSHGIAPKNLVDDIYCRAYAVINGKEYYSETLKYSGLQYLKNMIAKTADTTEEYALYTALLNYAAAAQNKFDYKTDTLATDDFVNISVSGGTLSDGFTYGLIKHSAVVTIVADPAPQGSQFKHWTDGDGNVLGTSETLEYAFDQNATVIAEYETAATEGLNYVVSKDGEGYAISGIDFGNVATVVIPTYYNGIPVTEIAVNAFKDNAALTSVIIPDGVKAIASGAFSGCLNMETVCVPSDLKAIGESAFKNCAELSEIVIPDSVIEIGANAFTGCDSLTSVTIPENVKSVGGGAFSDCDDLTNIDWNAWDCETAGSYSEPIFAGNDSVNTVTIGENVQKIPDNLFKDLASVTEIVIPDSVTEIGANAFTGCESLQTLVIPESVSAIGDFVANGCVSLEKICFKGSLSAWADITIGDNNPLFVEINVFFYIEIEPVAEGKFWRIINGEIVVYVIVHDYKPQITEPTCTEQGYTTYVCSRCGDEYVDNYVSALGHNYENGVCTRCGEPDPDYVAPAFTQGLIYELNSYGERYSVKGIGTATDTDIIIPATYEGKPVTTIWSRAFIGCSSLTSIIIPDGVTSIYEYAFSGCSSLTSIIIPDSVTSIGDHTFYNCRNLTSINIPDRVTSIGSGAFDHCCGLTSITIPDKVTSIGDCAFYACSSLESINIPDSVTSIGYSAFYGCSSLTSITIPDSVTNIGQYAFSGCSSLTNINIPDSVTSISQYAFSGCSSLTSITIPEGVKFISQYAFSDCSSLTNIDIPNSMVSIQKYAFSGCSSLESITIPEGVTSIRQYAFNDCSSLITVTIGKNSQLTIIESYAFYGCSNLHFNEYDNAYYLGNDDNPYVALIKADNTSISSCTINVKTKCIAGNAFSGCSNLTSVTIGENSQLTSIGAGAFYECSNLTSVTMGNRVSSIDEGAFFNCKELTSINIPDSMTSIGGYAFYGCSGLTAVYYGGTESDWENIKIVRTNGYLTSATRYYYSETQPDVEGNFWHYVNGEIVVWQPYVAPSFTQGLIYELNSDGASYSVTGIGTATDTDVIIPATYEGKPVTKIGDNAFKDVYSLTNVNIPNSVTSIGAHAFDYCGNLKSITIPDGVTIIGDSAFESCFSLTSVTFGQDCALESIGGSAFFCCGLTEIVIPNSVTNIGLWAFRECGIRSVSFKENSRLEKIRGAFFSCGALTSVNIPASVTSIEYGAFESCDNITVVYYGGTESDWAEINIDLMFSDEFKNATRYYYSETQPDAEGNFWHYVNGEIVVW